MEDNFKEVNFYLYCKTCRHKDLSEQDQPCYDCLNVPARQDSHKPERYEKNE